MLQGMLGKLNSAWKTHGTNVKNPQLPLFFVETTPAEVVTSGVAVGILGFGREFLCWAKFEDLRCRDIHS